MPDRKKNLWKTALDSAKQTLPSSFSNLQKLTDSRIVSLCQTARSLADGYNLLVDQEPLQISVTDPAILSELAEALSEDKRELDETYSRFLISTYFWLISVRGRQGVIELFNLPISAIHELVENELPSRAKVRLELDQATNQWTISNAPVEEKELNTILRSLLKDMAVRSKGDLDLVPEALRFPLAADGQSLAASVKELVVEKGTLVQRIVTQQESIQNWIAREIHDTVIANIGRLKRAVLGERQLSQEQMLLLLDETGNRLRELCHDLTPYLGEWGLPVVLEDMVERLGEHTGARCRFTLSGDWPDLPEEVQLHIFRIAQECVNNIEKYAQAGNITLSVTTADNLFTLTVKDDGTGFDLSSVNSMSKQGGRGTGIMKERAELISAYLPCQLSVDSKPGGGTSTVLRIHLS